MNSQMSPSSTGSIPAWAGEPSVTTSGITKRRVYPRVGGGTRVGTAATNGDKGLSPRGRGNPIYSSTNRLCFWSIPAWAGEPIPPLVYFYLPRVYPRVGGGTVSQHTVQIRASGLSPRGRGNRQPTGWPRDARRSIPAWAGEPYSNRSTLNLGRVYPRVGGGTPERSWVASRKMGLSPRGRGNRIPTEAR